MNQSLRVTLVLILIFTVGTFQYAKSFLLDNSSPPQSTISSFKLDVSYETNTSAAPQEVRVNDYGDVEQGSFFLQHEREPGLLVSPLLNTKVDIDITGLIARTRVTQIFTNTRDDWVNGLYAFPLPENAAVDHLEMQIGERRIIGEIQPKQKAEAIYQQAKREGRKASLLVQQRPNLFKSSVANIGPDEKIHVTIEYQQAINYDDKTFSLRFPTTVNERYLPQSTVQDPDIVISENGWGITQPVFEPKGSLQQNEPSQKFNKVAINISLNAGFELNHIQSEFHPIIQTQTEEGVYAIRLKQDMIANQDFVLKWQSKPNESPEAAHFMQQTEHGYYGMVMLMPPDSRVESQRLARDVTFIVDTSGSMSGESMQQAKASLLYAIDALHPDDYFNLIDFNASARQLWPISKVANEESKNLAGQYLRRLSADGGTEMLAALKLALGHQAHRPERLRQVIFITDGSVGNEAQLFSYIQDNLQNSRLFTVGIGSAPNSFFMAEAARMGRGSFTYIGSVDAVKTKMKQLFEKLTHPVLADLRVNLSSNAEFYPRKIPDLYKGQPLMISYKSLSPLNTLTMTGSLRSRYWQKSMSLQKGATHTGLDVLWARRKIAQLNRDKTLGDDHNAVNEQILKVAMAHHLVSSMTSLIAVEQRPTALDTSRDAQIKNQAPKSQLSGTLPQTATPAQLQLLIALLFIGTGLCTVIFTRSR